ncbi:MAG: GNAT family protein [Kiloniellales bacterium]
MSQRTNEYGQPIGEEVPNWTGRQAPLRRPMQGRYTRLEPLSFADHANDLFEAYSLDKEGILWTYMGVGPFSTFESFRAWMEPACQSNDPLFHAIIDAKSEKAIGFASYLRIDPPVGVIEVGFIAYSPLLQRSRVATEAMFLMMARVFDELGYRRYEWKCDSLNAPSRAAAQRLGFTYDGLFEQATVYKGRNRDTAWFSILDRDWPRLRAAYEAWLDPANFTAGGQQKRRLADLITEHRG